MSVWKKISVVVFGIVMLLFSMSVAWADPASDNVNQTTGSDIPNADLVTTAYRGMAVQQNTGSNINITHLYLDAAVTESKFILLWASNESDMFVCDACVDLTNDIIILDPPQTLESGIIYWIMMNGTGGNKHRFKAGATYPYVNDVLNFTSSPFHSAGSWNANAQNVLNFINVTVDNTTVAPPPPAAPTFTTINNNATGSTITNDVVNWTVTILDDVELSDCWFTHNDSGSLVNETVQGCTTPFIFDQSITITASTGENVCGFFGANNTNAVEAQTANSCFDVAELTPPQFVGAANNASSIVINDVVQFTVNLTDNFGLGSWTFGVNDSGGFVNGSTTFVSGQTSLDLSVNQTVTDTPNQEVCGRFYFNDTFGNENVSQSCFVSSDLFRVNITAFNANTNATIAAFTAVVEGVTNTSFIATRSTTSGLAQFNLPLGNYSVRTNASTFSNGTGFVNVLAPVNGSFSMFPDPSSISLIILREGNGSLITQRVDIEVLGPTVDVNFNTSTGIIFMGGLESGTHNVVVSSTGFSTRSYFVTLAQDDHTSLTARLVNLTSGNVQEVTFTIKDSADAVIGGATMTVAKRINATFFTIGQRTTDISGQVVFDLDSTIIYEFTISADTFIPRQFQLLPTQTSYDIILTPSATINFTTVFDFISYATEPTGSLVTAVPTNFTLTTVSAEGIIQFFGFNVSAGNRSQFVNVTGSPSGGSTVLTLNLSDLEGQTVTASYFIQGSGFGLFEFNRTFYVGIDFVPARTTVVGAAEEHGDQFSGPIKALVAVVASGIAALVLADLIGVAPAALGALAVQIGFVVIGWIGITHMVLMGIVMAGVWLLLGRRSQ